MSDEYTIPLYVLNDVCSRFIINVPEEERNDLIRIFFQIELAHWFYLDFFCTENYPDLKPCSIRDFARDIFLHIPFLTQHSDHVDAILSEWKLFKHAVPTNGAIILDETMKYVLLVQGFWAKASWGFPKGKVVEEETEMKCAIREVLEEIGFDITDLIQSDQYLQVQINEQTIRLYIITNVSRNEKFEPRTRREIKEVRWFAVDELPTHKKDTRTKLTLGFSPNSFFMVIPFVRILKQWIAAQSHTRYQKNHSESISYASSNQTPTSSISGMHTSATYPNLSQHQHSSNKKSPTNNVSIKDELKRQKQQTQYFNKLNKEEYNELLSCRTGSGGGAGAGGSDTTKSSLSLSSSKYQKNKDTNNPIVSLGSHSNSRFKPINKSSAKNTSTTATASTLSTSTITSSNTPGLLNITRKPQSQQQSAQQQHGHHHHHHHSHTSQQQKDVKAKKQLDFYGPECWLNFKFNQTLLLEDLPMQIS